MKKVLLALVAAAFLCPAVSAQNFMVINSEKVFKSSEAYKNAVAEIGKMAEGYQKTIDENMAELDNMFNTYQAQKQYLSEQARQSREEAIIEKEKEVNKYRETVFGAEGTLMKKRVELIKPVQDRIFGIIDKYAADNGFQLVLDISTSPNVLYYSPSIDRTEQIITLIK